MVIKISVDGISDEIYLVSSDFQSTNVYKYFAIFSDNNFLYAQFSSRY